MKNELSIEYLVDTLRGESPKSGYSTIVFSLNSKSNRKLSFGRFIDIVNDSDGEIITFIGKPFRQLPVLSEFILSYEGTKEIIIETSGRISKTKNRRHFIVPILRRATVVISPSQKGAIKGHYTWLNNYEGENIYWKFKWQGSRRNTLRFINNFFKYYVVKDVLSLIQNKKIVVMPNNISDIEECRSVWDFCLTYRLRYSGRENKRLWEK